MLASFCEIGGYRDGRLMVHTQSNAAATQLRFISPSLIPQLNQIPEFQDLKIIDYKVISPKQTKPKVGKIDKPLPVSMENRKMLEETAEEVSSVELANSLKKLAKTLKDKYQ